MDSTPIWLLLIGIFAATVVATIFFWRRYQKKRLRANMKRFRDELNYELWTSRLSPRQPIEIIAKTPDPPETHFESEAGEVETLLARREEARQMLVAAEARRLLVPEFLQEIRSAPDAQARLDLATPVLKRADDGFFGLAQELGEQEIRLDDFDDAQYKELFNAHREATIERIDELLPKVSSGQLESYLQLRECIRTSAVIHDMLVHGYETSPSPKYWFELCVAYVTAALAARLSLVRSATSEGDSPASDDELIGRLEREEPDWKSGVDQEVLNALLSLMVNDRAKT